MKTTAAILLPVTCAILMAASKDYHVAGKIHIGGDGGWDYVLMDSPARRLYVSHATHVVVVDPDTEKVVGDIPDTPGVHGIAIATRLNRGYTSNGRANNVTVFDLKTLKTVTQVNVGQNPDAIWYDAATNRVFTFNGKSKDATVIDASANQVVSTIPLGGKPEFSAADGKGKLYVNIEDTHEMAEIDMAKMSVTKRYTLAGCEDPSGLAMDTSKRRLFSVCGNNVMIVSDPDSGKVVDTLPIGEGADGAGFDSGTGLAFSSNGEGTLTVVREASGKYGVAETVKTQRGARTMVVDPKTHKIYLPTAEFGPSPAPTAQQPRPRPAMIPGSFVLLVLSNQ